MKMDEKNESWQAEFDQMKALLHELQGEEISMFRGFIETILRQKEEILNRFCPKESCISVKLDYFGLDTCRQAELLQVLFLADERIWDADIDILCGCIELYPAKPEHTYVPIKIDHEKHYGSAEMNSYIRSFSQAEGWFQAAGDIRCGVTIEKTVTLNDEDFAFFGRNIGQDTPFTSGGGAEQFVDHNGECHCILVKPEGSDHGILLCRDEKSGEFYSGYFPNMEWFEQPEQALDTPENGMDLC